jgi:hypothetical protein
MLRLDAEGLEAQVREAIDALGLVPAAPVRPERAARAV